MNTIKYQTNCNNDNDNNNNNNNNNDDGYSILLLCIRFKAGMS